MLLLTCLCNPLPRGAIHVHFERSKFLFVKLNDQMTDQITCNAWPIHVHFKGSKFLFVKLNDQMIDQSRCNDWAIHMHFEGSKLFAMKLNIKWLTKAHVMLDQ